MTKGERTDQERANIIKNQGPKWFLYVITTLANRCKTCTRQLYYLTMVLQFRGLSGAASNLTSHLGLTMQTRSYKRYDEEFMAELEGEIK